MRRNHGTQFCDCFTPTNRFKIFFEIVEYAEKIMIIVKFDDNLSTVSGRNRCRRLLPLLTYKHTVSTSTLSNIVKIDTSIKLKTKDINLRGPFSLKQKMPPLHLNIQGNFI